MDRRQMAATRLFRISEGVQLLDAGEERPTAGVVEIVRGLPGEIERGPSGDGVAWVCGTEGRWAKGE